VAAKRVAADQRIGAARAEVESSRLALVGAVVAEANRGTPQVEIIRRSGYARGTVKQILRDGACNPTHLEHPAAISRSRGDVACPARRRWEAGGNRDAPSE
jgi:hypothetical protein